MKNIVLLLLYVSFLNTYFFSKNNYTVSGSQILKNNVEWEFVGTNNMAAFSIPYNYNTQQSFGMDIVRECIDLKLTSNETLESIISTARSKGFVIILAGFWYDNDAFIGGTTPYPECQLLGRNP